MATFANIKSFIRTFLKSSTTAEARAALEISEGSGTGDLLSTNNLSDVASAATSRTNLGLGTAATTAATDYATAAQGTLADSAIQTADIDTLAEVNAIITDATLIDTADSRLSDARTPTAHTHTASEVTDFDTEVGNNTAVAANTAKISFDSTSSTRLANTSGTNTGDAPIATDAIWDAKGDLLGGTGADTASRLAVGADDLVLTADSAEVTGLKWAAAGGSGDFLADGSVPMTGNLTIPEYIYHAGDTGTNIRFTSNRQDLIVASKIGLSIDSITSGAEIQLNASSQDWDVGIKNSSAHYAFYVQASDGFVALGGGSTAKSTPSEQLDVTGNIKASGTVEAASYIEGETALGTVVSTSTIVASTGSHVTATLTASTACTFTMPTAEVGLSFVLHLKQAVSTGNGTAAFTNVIWSGGTAPTITATAGRMDIISFVTAPDAAGTGYKWYGSIIQDFTPT